MQEMPENTTRETWTLNLSALEDKEQEWEMKGS
jgi:hypothetical protein